MDSTQQAKTGDGGDGDDELQKAIEASLGPQEDMQKVLMMSALDEIHRMEVREQDPSQRQRAEGMCVGLRNIGNSCYVNSLMQTYFLLPPLRDAILRAQIDQAAGSTTTAAATAGAPEQASTDDMDEDMRLAMAMSLEQGDGDTAETTTDGAANSGGESMALDPAEEPSPSKPESSSVTPAGAPPTEEKNQEALVCLLQLQRVFALLCHSHRRYVDPCEALNLLFKLGGSAHGLEIGVQEDVTEFNDMFLTCIEAGLLAAEPPASPGAAGEGEVQQSLVTELFFGKMEVLVEAEEADGGFHMMAPTIDTFSSNLLQVHSGSLAGSLEELQGWELMETPYTTEKGHTSTTAKKKTKFSHIPKVMIFPLQRLRFNRELGIPEKLHDEFKFPDVVSLAGVLGCAGAAGEDGGEDGGEYVLLSVLMHKGKAESGHYWSFVKDGARWLKFNDTEVHEVSAEVVLEQGKGSSDSDASASCLVYVEKGLLVGEDIDTNGARVALAGDLQLYVTADDAKFEIEIAEWNERVAAEAEAAAKAAESPIESRAASSDAVPVAPADNADNSVTSATGITVEAAGAEGVNYSYNVNL